MQGNFCNYVNITILIQYKDTFDDVGNVLASGSQKFQRRELIGGIPFGIETRKKEIRINKQMKSLDEIKVEVINQTREDVKVSNAAVRRNDGEWVISLVLNGVSKNVLGSRETLRGLLA